jgi:uroporphyrinogen decarboxylase
LGFGPQPIAEIAPVEPEDYFDLDVRYATFDPPVDQAAFLRYLAQLPKDIYLGSLDRLKTYDQWSYHPELGPDGPLSGVQTLGEMAEFAPPSLVDVTQHPSLTAQVETWHREGLAVAGASPHLGGDLFETAYRLRGFENFLIDLVERKELAHYLLDQLTAMLTQSALLLAQAGVDILMLDDDVAATSGLIVSPHTWREFFRPRLASVIQAAREVSPDLLVFYHSDGDFTRLVPDLIEIGVNVINPVQPDCMDAAALKRAFGDRLALWGTVGTAAQWDLGTPDEMREEIRERIATLGRGGGLMIAPAYDVDFTPFENIAAFFEAVQAHG